MQQYPNNNNPFSSEEIDIIAVLKKVISTYHKWKKFILFTFLLGISLATAFFYFSPKTYLTRMYLASNLIKGPSFIVLLDDLQKHIKEKNYDEVSRYMNLDLEMVKKISKIEFYSARNFAEKEYSDLITQSDAELEKDLNNNEFVIQAYISDNGISKILEKGIIYYLENNRFSKMKSTMRKEGLKLVRTRIKSELSQLDSLRYTLNSMYTSKNKVGGNGGSSIIMNDPSAIYNNILNLFRTEIATSDDINTPDIIVIQSFVTYKKHYSPRLSNCLLSGGLIAIIFSLIFIFFSEIKRKLSEAQ
ncbi:MAG: hypothetical protein EAZ07_02345 [Cytophagales bacterium]|nr:MAG: hypothetical protein EAZ07_02345 [Cytophagales bacterium]